MSDSLLREPSVEEISKPRIKQKQDEPLISKILTYLFFLNDLFPIQSWCSKKRQTSRIRWWMLMTKIGSHYALLECLNGRAGGILDPLVSEIVSAHELNFWLRSYLPTCDVTCHEFQYRYRDLCGHWSVSVKMIFRAF